MSDATKHPGNTRRLEHRRILITGAGSGIGRTTAELFAAEGARLALLDLNIDAATPIATQCAGIALGVDISNEDAVQCAVREAADALGGLDGIVNAAGVIALGPIEDTDLHTWQWQIAVNMTGPFLICRAALPWLRQAVNATIVNISSAQAFRPLGASCAYAASKAGVLNFTRALAAELAPDIRANAVCPGIVDTPMVAQASKAAGRTAATPTAADYPLGRMAQPEEIARAILFLSSNESSYVTGSALAVDGGRCFH